MKCRVSQIFHWCWITKLGMTKINRLPSACCRCYCNCWTQINKYKKSCTSPYCCSNEKPQNLFEQRFFLHYFNSCMFSAPCDDMTHRLENQPESIRKCWHAVVCTDSICQCFWFSFSLIILCARMCVFAFFFVGF